MPACAGLCRASRAGGRRGYRRKARRANLTAALGAGPVPALADPSQRRQNVRHLLTARRIEAFEHLVVLSLEACSSQSRSPARRRSESMASTRFSSWSSRARRATRTASCLSIIRSTCDRIRPCDGCPVAHRTAHHLPPVWSKHRTCPLDTTTDGAGVQGRRREGREGAGRIAGNPAESYARRTACLDGDEPTGTDDRSSARPASQRSRGGSSSRRPGVRRGSCAPQCPSPPPCGPCVDGTRAC